MTMQAAVYHGQSDDAVLEVAGGTDTFEMAWRIARPNAVVAVVAMYEEPQVLPLNQMYGKNLQFKTGGVDAVHCEELMRLIAAGKLNTDLLISRRESLGNIVDGYQLFGAKAGNGLKWVITP